MNSRKLIALFMVFTLTGTAMAAGNTFMSHEAEGVTAIQQHSVFVELVLEEDDRDEDDEIHEFGAVVGLVKECIGGERSDLVQFDNAVLWFNDQFLFGDKDKQDSETGANVTEGEIGVQPPNRTYDEDGTVNDTAEGPGGEGWVDIYESSRDGNDALADPGFIGANHMHERWGGCFIPDGFMHAVGHEDPYGTGGETTESLTGGTPDFVRQLIDLDNDCNGCIFEYEATFYVTDPNGVDWMVDKLVYAGSLNGDVFASGGGEDCYDGSGMTAFEDPRSTGAHADQCEDQGTGADNHRNYGGDGGDSHGDAETLAEPIYTVHIQVDPDTGTGFADQAQWQYESGEIREGMPYAINEGDDNFENPDGDGNINCKEVTQAHPCAIEYNFLLTVDFAAFNGTGGTGNYDQSGENHSAATNDTSNAHTGDSHPHNPETPAGDRGPAHDHATVDLDLFFYEDAPFFVVDNPYWDSDGAPPQVDNDCSQTDPNQDYSAERDAAVENRAAIVCDTSTNDGQFHLHDGSQTIE